MLDSRSSNLLRDGHRELGALSEHCLRFLFGDARKPVGPFVGDTVRQDNDKI